MSMRRLQTLYGVHNPTSIYLHPAHACIQRPPNLEIALDTKDTPESTVHDSRDA